MIEVTEVKTSYVITAINLMFQIVYMLFGGYTVTELGNLQLIFYIFRPEYLIISGVIAIINILILIVISVCEKKCNVYNIIVILLNIEYIIFYICMMRLQ